MSVRNFVSQGRKIVAIGRNFRRKLLCALRLPFPLLIGPNLLSSEHAKELNNPVPKSPFFFLKPTSSYLPNGGNVEIPKGCDVHHETIRCVDSQVVAWGPPSYPFLVCDIVELGVVIGKDARDIPASEAFDYIAGYALGIDMTARNLQFEAKTKGLPWSAAKGFDTFTPISDFIPKSDIPDPSDVNLWLKLDDVFKQNGNTSDMIFNFKIVREEPPVA
ncbi:hypothetical protein BC937DRAFT_94177 [Endogone sp. FLAS-F59071]|nr:hypothetical protein BC937DRAFT_94177 [Endogone sp. FLAS-F59071]|eukprot:RUS20865.1 hypothetical protein BC937DRAFT_94177 [Endogone sp. FLAS-F59071]